MKHLQDENDGLCGCWQTRWLSWNMLKAFLIVKETRIPIPAESGKPKRFDYQYERNSTANLFMVNNPIEGWRTVEVTERRTAIDLRREGRSGRS